LRKQFYGSASGTTDLPFFRSDSNGFTTKEPKKMSSPKEIRPKRRSTDDLAWLKNVREVRHPLSTTRPLWVKHVQIDSGGPLPEPAMPTPEWHPHCELSYIFQGHLMQFVGGESIEKRAGDMMLLGGGMPHYGMHLAYPLRYVTVYFTPSLLFELGPEGDGARAMARFVGAKRIEERVVRLPSSISRKVSGRFEQMVVEFSAWALGSELRLRALLLENIVDLLRWERSLGRNIKSQPPPLTWPTI